jgi:hypothetical protein
VLSYYIARPLGKDNTYCYYLQFNPLYDNNRKTIYDAIFSIKIDLLTFFVLTICLLETCVISKNSNNNFIKYAWFYDHAYYGEEGLSAYSNGRSPTWIFDNNSNTFFTNSTPEECLNENIILL